MTEQTIDIPIDLECGEEMTVNITLGINLNCTGGGGGGGGEISFVGSSGNTGTNTSTPPAIDLTALVGGVETSPATGDLVFVSLMLASGNSDHASAVVDNGFTIIDRNFVSQASFRDNYSILAYKFMGETPDTSVTFSGFLPRTADGITASALVFRGVDETTPLDGVAVGFNSDVAGNGPDSPEITPTTAGAVVVVAGCGVEGNSVTAFDTPSDLDYFFGLERDAVIACRSGLGYKVMDTAAAFNPDAWTPSTADSTMTAAAYSVCLRPA